MSFMKKQYLHLIPFVILILAGIGLYLSGLTHYVSLNTLRTYHLQIIQFTDTHPVLTPLLFIGSYIIVAALSLPLSIYLTLVSGFLFKQPYALIYVVIGATLGASIIFLAARYALWDFFKERSGPYLRKFEKGFQQNEVSYMLFLRLIPLFPYWVVNLVPAFLGVRFTTFVWTTAVGIIPSTFAFTQIGRGLETLLDSNAKIRVISLLNPDILLAFIALGLIALTPILLKWWNRNIIVKGEYMDLKIGSEAPDFTLPNSEGKKFGLKQFRNQWVVLYFYPEDDTPNCTSQACSFTNELSIFKDLNAVILGVSPDSPASHQKFISKHKINVELLSDEKKEAINAYGVWGMRKWGGKEFEGVVRTTFLIDPNGKIAAIWPKVNVAGHSDEVKTKIKELTIANHKK